MNFRYALAAATMLVLPVAAKAQPISGPYISLGAGVNIMQNENASVTVPPISVGGHLQTRVGPAVAVAFGYHLSYGLRAEIEGNYRYNDFGGGGAADGGQEQKFGAMFNVLYYFVGMTPYFEPYAGVGAGYQWVQERNLHASGIGPGFVPFTAAARTDTEGRFAYQGILGAAFPISSMSGLALTADYRFMGLVGDRNYGGTVTRGAVTVPSNFKLSSDYNHTILLGVRYVFGAPPPPPVAPAPAAVAPSPISRSYLVFFDWDKATLTDRARQIVSEAAANSTKVQYTQLEVNGYTDTSGTPQYNQGLSVRRAQAVAAELVKDGVPKSAIAIQGFGETHLLVPTGAGVREPQNRRVEIIIK